MKLIAFRKRDPHMRFQLTPTNLVAYSLLGLAAVVSFALPDSLTPSGVSASPATAKANTIRLPGTVWDFKKGHADFPGVNGSGHHAGNLAFTLDASDRPEFTGAGYKVGAQWYDKNSNPIPPHLFGDPNAIKLASASAPSIDKDAFFDTWDSGKGAYNAITNKGAAPSLTTGATMPTITLPNIGGSTGVASYKLICTLNANLHCSSFSTEQSTILSISGHRTIVCDGDFVTGKLTQILILPNSSLKLYVGGQLKINQTSQVNMNTWVPSRCRIYCTSDKTVEINQSNQVCAQIIAPKATMHLAQNDHFYGTFVGNSMDLDQSTGFHHDGAGLYDICNNQVKDTKGSSSGAAKGAITAKATFAQWYADTMGTNLSGRHTIDLVDNGSGVYEYLDDAFYPIDGLLFGNEGQKHNNYFTYSIRTTFTYNACGGQFFEFQGTDDAWLFINGDLAMDLGGIVPGTQQHVEMDRMNLTDGQMYTFDFFYAQRQSGMAIFRMRTNLPLVGDTSVAAVSAGFD